MIHMAMSYQEDAMKDGIIPIPEPRLEKRARSWQPNPVRYSVISARWCTEINPLQWEVVAGLTSSPTDLEFPPESLGAELIDLFFERASPILPLIHEPSFRRNVETGIHLKDLDFARLYLLVCATASRYSSDARVCVIGTTGSIEWNSAGWNYFNQVISIDREPPSPTVLPLYVTTRS